MKQTLTAEEISERLKVHPNTIKSLAIKGKIPAMKVGVQWRFYLEDVEKALKFESATNH